MFGALDIVREVKKACIAFSIGGVAQLVRNEPVSCGKCFFGMQAEKWKCLGVE